MDSRINKTLLDKLFRNPMPLDRKKQIFYYLYERMFPCREVMEDFLTKVDAGERTACAKYIVQRLCFEANFPPPYYLLVSLLDFEKGDENQSASSSYIPQDHFSHIVYMYFLGIYLFFYSPTLNRTLTKEFMRQREEAGYNPVLDATKDFISFWKYFCLFHDVAYPIESADGANENSKYLLNFNKIEYFLSHEIMLEGAAKYLVVWQMLHDSDNNQLFSNVIKLSKGCRLEMEDGEEEKDLEEIKTMFGKYQSIDKIHCFEHFKMLTGFVSSPEYIIVLFDASSELPVAFKYMEPESGAQYYILKNKYSIPIDTSIHKLLDHEDYMLHEGFFIRYYFKDLDAISKRIHLKIGNGRYFDERKIRLIIDEIHKLSVEKDRKPERMQHFTRIATSHDLNTYIFQCYKSLSVYSNSVYPPEEKLSTVSNISPMIEQNQKAVRKYLDEHFKNTFQYAVVKQMSFVDYKQALERMGELETGSVNELTGEKIKKIVNEAVDYLFDINKLKDYKEQIKEKFAKEILDAVNKEKDTNSAISTFIWRCNKEIIGKGSLHEWSFLTEQGVDIQNMLDMLKEYADENGWLEELEKYLNTKMENPATQNISLEDFIKKYKTEHYMYDHGIYGALIFLLCFQFYGKVIERLFGRAHNSDSIQDVMSALCWNVEKTKYENKLKKDYKHVNSAVVKSIFFHNLYPDMIRKIYSKPDAEWKYDLLKEPSVYFGMMVDALQVWNREKYYQHRNVDWYSMFSSDYYDIVIEHNRIVLKVKSYHNDITQVINKLLAEKDTYLKDFSLLVRVEIQDV